MHIRSKILSVVFVFMSITVASVPAFALSADDFIPPVQVEAEKRAELLDVKDAASVTTSNDANLDLDVTTALTLQDAINSVIAKSKVGCQLVHQAGTDGITFVATGMGTYNANYENVLASRIEQRNAYVTAFMDAKAQMAKTVGELVIRGATTFDRDAEVLSTEKKTITNIERDLSEAQCQVVRKVLKGYVTYSISDDGKGRVYVTIVSTPKTRGRYTRNGTNGIAADNLHDGLDILINEIKNGLVPSVGGRIIEVPGTGETAWVGFGSSIVRKDSEPDIQAELDIQAERIAEMRAVDALAGIIFGDDTSWEGHADEQTKTQVKDYERLQRYDQSTRAAETEIKEYENRLKTMQNILASNERIKSIRKGILPPGIMRQTDIDEDGYFAYGIAVYVPSASELARKGAKDMDNANIVQRDKDGRYVDPGSETQKSNENLEMKKGPSGVIQQNL